MFKYCVLLFFICTISVQSQTTQKSLSEVKKDSTKKKEFLKYIGNGYFPTKYFNFDLRYLIKFNQYEGVRTGLGGVTNKAFSEKFRINSYGVYGFRDHRFKYSIGGGIRLAERTSTWLNLSYTNDLQETGSTKFLTDGRFFQFFEPRLLNIDLFHKHITKALAIEHQVHPKLLSEAEFAISNIDPTYQYGYVIDDQILTSFHLSTAIFALHWSPFSKFQTVKRRTVETKIGYPKFSLQYTKSFNNVFESNIGLSKIDFKTIHRFGNFNKSFVEIALVSGIASGNVPLTHLYHAYPNNINKQTILQRFSVAGLNSFETMYFNEFFSDKFVTTQLKYFLKPFEIAPRFKPQMVLITRYALGDIREPQRHLYVNFDSLKKGFTESGFEINKLFFGFGLSFTYRYGAYHLSKESDNFALKFTFNVSL